MAHEVRRGVPWPYPNNQFPQNLGMVVQRTVIEGTEPARVAIHWADGDWTVADDVNDPNGNAMVVCVEHLVTADDTFAALAAMPPETQAFRQDLAKP
ncbi:hypothetical protein GFY24_39580 [Nocardia sp. SYP-A9097]|uniref:hypothetical protein n=1 Tax=Nocardia sp. SYP-A9097 TaxID=2663237 RepID=UPI00129B4BF5|nr:hypothetical protein [Nocardia sp. SYP-A9097]MRH93442.1 hypothetical protein [Nocardia sp. SYP-A9097]